MPRLTYDELFARRIDEKNPDLRAFLEKAEDARRSMSQSYDRDTAMVEETTILLHGRKSLRRAHSESLDKIAEFVRRHAPKHQHANTLQQVAREISAYHYSRMR